MTTTAPTNIQNKSVQELVKMLMPAAHERRGRHVSASDEYPTTIVDSIRRGTGRHRGEPIAISPYLESNGQARHRALPATLFELVKNN